MSKPTFNEQFIKGLEYAAALYESVNPSSDMERQQGDPGAGAMGAVLEYRDLIRKHIAWVRDPRSDARLDGPEQREH